MSEQHALQYVGNLQTRVQKGFKLPKMLYYNGLWT